MAFLFSGTVIGALTRPRLGSGRRAVCMSAAASGVAVSGATGRTGRLVVSRLLALEDPIPVHALARSTEKAKEVLPESPQLNVFELNLAAEKDLLDAQLHNALLGVGALVILASAVPELVPHSNPPQFRYPPKEMPEQIDWQGGKAQVDAAIKAGISRIVVIGSMGSTNPDLSLNKAGNGNILKYKRRLQEHVIECCERSAGKTSYCIINPGSLTNGLGGIRKLIHGKNDNLQTLLGDRLSVSRDDVAHVVISALTENADANTCFDLASYPEDSETTAIATALAKIFTEATPGLL